MENEQSKGDAQTRGDSDSADVKRQTDDLPRRAMAMLQAGNLSAAERLYRELLDHSPTNADLLHLLGVTHHQMSHHELAAREISRAIELSPERAMYHNNLGEVFRAMQSTDSAESSYRRALALDPNFVDAMGNLGIVLYETGREREAEDCFKQALALNPRFTEAAVNLGNLLRDTGRLEEACTAFAQAVSVDPELAIAHLSLGNLLLDCERSDAALPHLQAAVRLRPDLPHTHFGMAGYSIEKGHFDAAERQVRKALELDPAYVSALWTLGDILLRRGELEAARGVLVSAIEVDDMNPQVFHTLGSVETAYGNREKAIECFSRAIALAPDMVKAYQGLVRAKRFSSSDPMITEKLEALARNDKLRPGAKASAHFTLAEIYDGQGDYDTAFRHCRMANVTRRKVLHYDPEAHARLVDQTILVFSRRWLDGHASFGSGSDRPIFIFGMPRSGTTLVEQIVSSHADVFGGGELIHPSNLKLASSGALDEAFLDRLSTGPDSGELIQRTASEYLSSLSRIAPDAARVTDKDPFKFFLIGLFAAALPHAKMIHCRRDAMDVGLSVYFRDFDNSHAYAFDLSEIGHYYAQYQRLMSYWSELLPGKILNVDYEHLVEEQEIVSRSILEHCGLEWDPRCLQFHSNPRSVLTASKWQVRRPMYSDSIRRWKHYERHLGDLRRGLGHVHDDDMVNDVMDDK